MTKPQTTLPTHPEIRTEALPILEVHGVSDLRSWASANRSGLLDAVENDGSLLVRGLPDLGSADFSVLAQELTDDLMAEREAFAMRQSLPGGVYSASAWPAQQPMCMHHELSYRCEVPSLMLFASTVPCAEGGAIGLADAASVLDLMPSEVVERFERDGWMLARSYNEEIGLSFAEAFGTDNRTEIEEYCNTNEIEFRWQADGGLQTRQLRRAVVDHQRSGHRCWFNQIGFLSEWTMDPDVREFLIDIYGPDGLPFTTRYGNGDPIEEEVIAAINEAYEATTVRETLRSGDLLLVDNIRTAHGREPYSGTRELVVALGNPTRMASHPA